MGGSDNPENLVRLSIKKHAQAHKKLYEEHGCWQDYVAWKALSGQMTMEEASKTAMILGGEKGREHLKGKTYEEAYGNERASQLKQKRVESNRRRKGIKYQSQPRNQDNNSNLIKICCLGCRKETSRQGFGHHLKKCF